MNEGFKSARFAVLAAVMLLPSKAVGQNSTTSSSQLLPTPSTNLVQAASPTSTQAISQTGLLPLFAVDFQFDPSWVDASAVPSKSPQFSHSGVNETFQKTWDALKPSGFNMIRFPVDLGDSAAPVRVANLCIWAKANSVSLVPVLKYVKPDRSDKAALLTGMSAFVSAIVSRMRQQDASVFSAYTQIAYYQLEDSMNHAGLYPKITPEVAQQMLLGSADAVRNAETQALQGTQVQATPILIQASLDYELIKQGGIAGVPLDPIAEQKARASLKQYLTPFASAANVDAVNVEWLPRSVSSGDVDHFAPLLRDLKATLPAKQLSLTTGFSSAFNSVDQQTQFFTLTFTNLADFRATDGASSNFLGAVFRQALLGPQADSKPPSTGGDPSQWNWNDKAQQLLAMWSQGSPSDAMSWWVTKVQDNLGLLRMLPNASGGMDVVPLSAQQTMQQISSTIAQVSQNALPPSSVPGASSFTSPQTTTFPSSAPGTPQNTTPPYAAAMGAQAPAVSGATPAQQFIFAVLQQFTTQMTTAFAARLTGGTSNGSQLNGYPASSPNNGAAGQVSPYSSNPSPYGTSAYTSSQIPAQSISPQPGAATYPTQPQPYANAIATTLAVGPQDISIDSSNVVPGQGVNITAQIHNTSPSQDVSGLSVALTSSGGTLPNLPGQSGISVPRSGTTPVQLIWVAPSSAGAYQLSVQVSDSTGALLASVPAPTIMVTSPSAAGSVGATIGTLGANSGSTSSSTSPLPGQPANPPVTQQPMQSPAATSQPQIVFFGATSSSSPTTAGQLTPLLLQIGNPSGMLLPPVQAQLLIDGSPTQTQTVGPLLPSQTRSALFSGIAATPGTHAIRVLVTSSDGNTQSADASAVVISPVAGNPAGSALAQPGTMPSASNNVGRNGLRTWTPTGTPAGTGSAAGANPTQKNNQIDAAPTAPAVTAAPPSPATSTATPTTITPRQAVSQPAMLTRSVPNTGAAPATQQSAASSNNPINGTSATSSKSSVRTITPSSPANPSGTPNANMGTRTVSGGAAATPSAPSQGTQVRTITPTITPGNASGPRTASKSSAKHDSGGVTGAQPQSSSSSNSPVRTITPGGTTSASNNTVGSSTHSNKAGANGNSPTSVPSNQGASSGNKQGAIDLSISTGDLRISPAAPRAGQSIMVAALIRNLGSSATQGATVVFRLVAGSRTVAASQPILFNIPARGTFQANWSTVVPAGGQFSVVAMVVANGDVNTANNQAALRFSVPAGSR